MFILMQQVLLYKNVAIWNFSPKGEGNALEMCDVYVCTSPPLSMKQYWVYKYSPHQLNSLTPHTKHFYIIKFTKYLN